MAANAKPAPNPVLSALSQLHNIKIGGVSQKPEKTKIKRRDLTFILSNLATLMENGVSLPRAIHTLAREKSLKNYKFVLDHMHRSLEAGESFSSAVSHYPNTFNDLVVNQIRVGERSGKIAEALRRIVEGMEEGNEMRRKILKRLSYPIIVMVAGSAVVAFMLLYIVPTFEETYTKANIPLPTATKILIGTGSFALNYGWLVVLGLVALVFGYFRLRKIDAFALWVDTMFLKLPGIGPWCRDIAVLQFMEVTGTMMESGFKVVDALSVSVGSVGNHAVRNSIDGLRAAVMRGERLSRQLEKDDELFPPIVSQLVIVGEQTGNLAKSTRYVREHLRKDIERRADLFVGAIEPILTIGMALAVCGILLAIYMPMFGMVDAVKAG